MKLIYAVNSVGIMATACLACTLSVAQDDPKGAQPPGAGAIASQQTGRSLPASMRDHDPGYFRISEAPLTPSGKAIKAAEALFSEGKFQDAVDTCKSAQQLIQSEGKTASYNPIALQNTLGYSLVELGDDAGALKYLHPYVDHGGGTYAAGYTAMALVRTGDGVRAAKLLNMRSWNYYAPAIESLWKSSIYGDPATELVLLARHYLGEDSMSVGEVKQALRHFKAAEAVDSHSTLVQYDLGMAYTKLGRYKDAAIPFAWAAKAGNPDLSNAAKLQLEHVRAIMKSMAVKPASKQ